MNRHNDLIRLIDAVWLLCKKTCTPGIACPDAICCEMWEEFKDIPSVDAVQVIRCRDCKYREMIGGYPPGEELYDCAVWRRTSFHEDGFCNYAKRREEKK